MRVANVECCSVALSAFCVVRNHLLYDNVLKYRTMCIVTRCLVDANFGRIRQLYRRSEVDCLDDLTAVVDHSTANNYAVTYRDRDGHKNWIWRDWKSFLAQHFKPVKGITKFRHFRFDADFPGIVFMKKSVDDNEQQVSLLKDDQALFRYNVLPEEIGPGGLSRERTKYLHDNIRPYVRLDCRDKTCPSVLEE